MIEIKARLVARLAARVVFGALNDVKRRRRFESFIAACHKGTPATVSDILNNPAEFGFSCISAVSGHGQRELTSDLDLTGQSTLEPNFNERTLSKP